MTEQNTDKKEECCDKEKKAEGSCSTEAKKDEGSCSTDKKEGSCS